MTSKAHSRAFLAVGALSLASAMWGCVADRPSRNGVFNENQYIRKDFLVRPGDSETPDQGWFVKATITSASEPNVFGDADMFGLYPGSHNNGALVHFNITNDKLQMINSREISSQTGAAATGRQPEVINAWSGTNVDLKYQVNLDGEKTNFYQENQELDWQQRQWIKVNLDKNDMSDLAPLGVYYNSAVAKCADESNASATLVTDSFVVDETNDYMAWAVQVTLPIKFDDADCMEAMGVNGITAQRLGREYETVTINYSFARADANPTYQPVVIDEHDSIKRKYGAFTFIAVDTDPNTGLLAAKEYLTRYDPTKQVDWYFEQGFPDQYKNIFTRNNLPSGVPQLPKSVPTIEDQTNSLLASLPNANPNFKIVFHEWNEPDANGNPTNHQFGDIRYNMVRFLQTFNQQESFAGVTGPVYDPRNGKIISTDIVFSNFAIQDYYIARIDAYLQSIGASPGILNGPWPTAPIDPNDPSGTKTLSCSPANVGAAAPIIPATRTVTEAGQSTLYQKMQGYLYKPLGSYGPLTPTDFIASHADPANPAQLDSDFYRAYYTYVPFLVYADPDTNPYVTPEGGSANTASDAVWSGVSSDRQFHALTSLIDHGVNPYDPDEANGGAQSAQTFMNQLKAYTVAHRNLEYAKKTIRYNVGADIPQAAYDNVTDFAFETVMQKDARHCILDADGTTAHWETLEEWQNNLVYTYWSQVAWHEFGHALGLEHNFMGNVDKNNFPTYTYSDPSTGAAVTRPTLYSSSVMEYNAVPDRVFWGAGWGPYDQGAIGWIYSNTGGPSTASPPSGATQQTQSGQYSSTYPWNDPLGFSKDGKTEIPFITCNERHLRYTPLCKQGDLGTTPSEITANEIENYEWQYAWRNFRTYHKFWDLTNYGDSILNIMTEQRRFLSLWAFDFSGTEITSKLQQFGFTPPASVQSSQQYYSQLTDKFTDEMSSSASLSAAFQQAVVFQSSGQRPYKTVFDNYFGDTTQQGITLDKLFAEQSFLALWPIDNYDPTQAQGLYEFSTASYGLADNANGTGIGSFYETVAEQSAVNMLGGSFDAFSYFKELGVSQWAYDTQSLNFIEANSSPVRQDVRDWVGGYIFTRLEDFEAYFRTIAVQNNFTSDDAATDVNCTTTVAACNYDPTIQRSSPADTFLSDDNNEFLGPDGRRYIWAYVPDRINWVVADRDRNIVTYNILKSFTLDTVGPAHDDGNVPGAAQDDLQQIKYFIDYYQQALYTPH
jgi:hypothetical protein